MPQAANNLIVAIFGQVDERATFLGTGWYVAPGYVLTCNHVVSDSVGPLSDRFVARSYGNETSGLRIVASSRSMDLALLTLEPALADAVETPRLVDHLNEQQSQRLRACPMMAYGFDTCDEGRSLKQYAVNDSLLMTGAAAESGVLVDTQLAGGLPAGFSGAPVLIRFNDGWVCSGMVRLGGESAATSRLIMPETVKRFLRDEKSDVPVVGMIDAEDVIQGESLDRLLEECVIREIAVMFTDMANSSKFAEDHGSRMAYEKRNKHDSLLVPLIAEHGGTFVERAGDSLLSFFSDVADAMNCAIAMQRRVTQYNQSDEVDLCDLEIHIRAGIHFGKAVVCRSRDGVEVAGQAINVAARVEAGAGKQTDQILLSETACLRLSREEQRRCEPVGAVDAKGVGQLSLHRVHWQSDEDFVATAQTLEAQSSPGGDAVVNGIFIDPNSGRGAVLKIAVQCSPSSGTSVSHDARANEQMQQAAQLGVEGAVDTLKRLGLVDSASQHHRFQWRIEGPDINYRGSSIGLAIALAAAAAYTGVTIDNEIAVTGALSQQRVTSVGGLDQKLGVLWESGKIRTVVLPSENAAEVVDGRAVAGGLHVIRVPTIEAAILDVLGPALGMTERRFEAATQVAASQESQVDIELWVQRSEQQRLKRDISIVPEEDTHSWAVGDTIRVCARVDQDCYLSVANVGTSGKVNVLLPNQHRTDTCLKAGEQTSFPALEDRFHFTLSGPAGRERLIAIATSEPMRLTPGDFDQTGAIAQPTTRDISIVAENATGMIIGRTEIEIYVSDLTDDPLEGSPPGRQRSAAGSGDWFDLG